ncbi:MAG: ADP-glyceromanno-heptose 6-epimerase [Candidatus Omnitrophica bacterium]|nr:ADP-glyceromanno-heptose 6-epimerase [Candidatus Omnitrophota bacterium]MBD3269344.1 ADP-glyceromanno-heptose 6-epimerase [Candidatus Omnitrophota bacterium]
MRVLVTGGAGFIGSNIVKLLRERGAKVLILDDFSHSGFKNIIDCQADVVCADVSDEKILKKLPRVDAIIHEAAITETTLKDDTRMVKVNFEGFRNILNYSLKNKIKLVYASSAGVYGEGDCPMKESQKSLPHNIYAYSKLLCDRLFEKVTRRATRPVIAGLRYFNVYGPGEEHKGMSASMVYHLYHQMRKGNSPRLFKYGEQRRDFIYVEDVARVTVDCLEIKKSRVMNLGTGVPRSFNDIVAVLNKLLNTAFKPDYFDNPYKGNYQNYTEADVRLLKESFKGLTFLSLEEGIEKYLKYLQNS